MVGYYNAYKGSTKTPVIYAGNKIVKKVYKGSELIYQIGFATFTKSAGTSLFAWTVPPGVTKIHVDCVASKGYNGRATAGNGGRVQCDVSVTGGQTLYITVGSAPTSNTNSYNATDIRTNNAGVTNTTSLNSRLVVAGGGGNGGNGEHSSNGGAGGGTTGGSGVTTGHSGTQAKGGGGGTQTAGGAGGSSDHSGNAGSFGLGGAKPTNYSGGAGGAGWYGGGSGGTEGHDGHYWNAGGGGGSSYAKSSVCTNVVHTRGYRNGAGYITISFLE